MLDGLIRFSLTQRLFVCILALAVMLLGGRAWLQLPVDAFPDISPTQVKIILKAPGMTAEEVEQLLTRPIETELLGIPRQAMLRSTTKYAITDITLDFREGTDIYWARQQVNERLANIRDSLPAGISGGVAPMSTPLSEMFMFTIENPALSLMERRRLLDWQIRPALRTIEGVADVNVLGGYARTYQVSPQAALMAQAGVSLSDLEQVIRQNNLNLGAGRLTRGNDTLIVRTEGRIDSLEGLANLVVRVDGNKVYRLSDVATVRVGHLARYGAVTRDGSETTEALIIALKDSNTARVVAGVKRKLAELQPTLPPGTSINVFYDRATLIDTAISTISSALVQAIVIVVLLLALFLGNIRAAAVVSLSLPLAALATFYLMSLFGLSANLMSLGGLVIAIGMIVDPSVVVVENIVTRLGNSAGLPRLHQIYRACLERFMRSPGMLMGVFIVLLVTSVGLFLLTGKTFMPVLDEGDIIVQLEKSPSISLEASVALDEQIERSLLQNVPEIRQIVARTGSDEIGLDPMSLNETDIFMELQPVSRWRFDSKAELIADIRGVLLEFPGINFGFTQPIQMRISEMLTGSSGDVSIKVFGSDIQTLARLAGQVGDVARQVQGSVDVQVSFIEGGKFLSVDLHTEIAQKFGMSTAAFSRYVKSRLEGVPVSEIIEGRERTPVVFAGAATRDSALSTINALQRQIIVLPDGGQAPLGELARVGFKEGPQLIEREKGNRFAVVTTNVLDRDIVGFVEELDERIRRDLSLPTGYSVEFGGEFENQQRATRNLLAVIPAALLLILIILFTTFRSMPKAALVLANIPFAIMGGLIALFFSGEYLSVPASVGLIALLGIAVLNGVVMVSYFEQTRITVSDLSHRILEGSARRLRPILMTATTAMFGLLPLVIATGPGAEIQKPLAIVVIGGLATGVCGRAGALLGGPGAFRGPYQAVDSLSR